MKLLRLSLILILAFCSQMAFSQDWTGKYQLVFDPDNPGAFILQVVPDQDGEARIGGSSIAYIITDPEVGDYDIDVIFGNWVVEKLEEGTTLECGRLWEADHGNPTDPITVEAGVPIDMMRFTPQEDLDCSVGRGARILDFIRLTTEEPDICEDYDDVTNGLHIGSNTAALTGIITNSDNPLTCPCDAPDAPSIAVTQPDCGETTGSVMVNNPLDSVLYTLLKDSVFEASDSSGEFTALTPGDYGILVTEGTCTSDTSFFTINEVSELPVISVSSPGSPAACGDEGTVVLGFTGVDDGSYDIEYDGGVFENVDVTDNSATISAPAGAYQNIRITAGDCTSAEGVNVSLSDPDAPEAPVVSVAAAECGVAGSASISNFDADLTYNFTPAGPSVDAEGNISGLAAGTGYVVTSTSEGCESEASAAFEIDEALEIPDAPVVSVTAAECGVAGSASIDNFDEALTYTFAPTGPSVDAEEISAV